MRWGLGLGLYFLLLALLRRGSSVRRAFDGPQPSIPSTVLICVVGGLLAGAIVGLLRKHLTTFPRGVGAGFVAVFPATVFNEFLRPATSAITTRLVIAAATALLFGSIVGGMIVAYGRPHHTRGVDGASR
jgi:hypothetical protein